MAGKQKQHPAAFKAQVALAAVRGDQTVNELASPYGIHPTLIHGWKKHLLAGADQVFSNGRQAAQVDAEAEKAELFEQIGRLKMEPLPQDGPSLFPIHTPQPPGHPSQRQEETGREAPGGAEDLREVLRQLCQRLPKLVHGCGRSQGNAPRGRPAPHVPAKGRPRRLQHLPAADLLVPLRAELGDEQVPRLARQQEAVAVLVAYLRRRRDKASGLV